MHHIPLFLVLVSTHHSPMISEPISSMCNRVEKVTSLTLRMGYIKLSLLTSHSPLCIKKAPEYLTILGRNQSRFRGTTRLEALASSRLCLTRTDGQAYASTKTCFQPASSRVFPILLSPNSALSR